MITQIKKIRNGYKVEEFIYEDNRIKKYKICYDELIKKINKIDFNDENYKLNLLIEKSAYKSKKAEDIFNNGILINILFIISSIFAFLIYPILMLPMFVFALYGIKVASIKADKFSRTQNIYDKLILYSENVDMCKKIKSNTFDGSIFSLYFTSEAEIKRLLEATEKNMKCSSGIEKNNYKIISESKVKKLVHKRNVKQ